MTARDTKPGDILRRGFFLFLAVINGFAAFTNYSDFPNGLSGIAAGVCLSALITTWRS